MRQGGRVTRVLLALLVAAAIAPARGAAETDATEAAAADRRRTVLVLIPVQPGRPLFDRISRGIAAEFLRAPGAPIVASIENLYDEMAPPQVAARQFELVRAKYAGQRIDAIIAVAHHDYLSVRERLGLSDRVPLIFLGERASQLRRPQNAVFVDATGTIVDSYRFMRPLFAPGHVVALLGGSAPSDRESNDETLRELRALVGPQRVLDLTNLSLREMRVRVGALPASAVLLMGSVLEDNQGRSLMLPVVMSTIAPVLHAPLVVGNDVLLGEGALGGALHPLEELGARAAKVALEVLNGASVDAMPTTTIAPTPMIDARQLRRLGLLESAVPPGTTMLWREPSIWEAYRGWFLVGVSVVVVQAALIAGLLAERRRRRESQRQLAERLRLQALVAQISTEFANLRGDRLDNQIIRSLARVGEGLGTEECAIFLLSGVNRAPRLVSRWPEGAHSPLAATVMEEALLTAAHPRLAQGLDVRVHDVGQMPGASEAARPPGYADALLFVPLRVDERVIGVLSLRHPELSEWPEDVRGDLRTIGEIIATAVVRKRTDASMRQQLEALAHVNRVASLGELAASLAHELNQPLAAILSNAEVAQHLLSMPTPPIDELRDVLADVIEDDERAGGIIRNMRSMLRRHQVEAVAIDVNGVVTQITRLVSHDAQLRAGALEVHLGRDIPQVTIDATQLKQVLLNLLVNATDAMASLQLRQPVALSTSAADGGVLIEVRDHGPGLSPEALPRLFDPFFTTKDDGLGVGLAISRSIIEAAGGRIAAANAPGGGARFTVWLPASRALDDDANRRRATVTTHS